MRKRYTQIINQGWLLFIMLCMSIILRVFDYLPFESFAMEITTLVLGLVFHLEKQNFIAKYNASDNEEEKEELEKNIKNRTLLCNLILGVLSIIMLIGYYDYKSEKKELVRADSFICESKGGFEVYVDKKEGWVLSDDFYFIKGKSR